MAHTRPTEVQARCGPTSRQEAIYNWYLQGKRKLILPVECHWIYQCYSKAGPCSWGQPKNGLHDLIVLFVCLFFLFVIFSYCMHLCMCPYISVCLYMSVCVCVCLCRLFILFLFVWAFFCLTNLFQFVLIFTFVFLWENAGWVGS